MKIGIYGYGNLGRGVECAIRQNADMELAGVFTRRDPDTVKILTEGAGVYRAGEVYSMKDEIDVLIICGGSATDLPKMTPELAQSFNVIDSFDNHSNIPIHFENVNKAAEAGGNLAIISVGWDPGMFSLNRLYGGALLPGGHDYTFWGPGVSQGHSDAVRKVPGVLDARQYTIPSEPALQAIRAGEAPELTARQKHTRECFVVAEPDADKDAIEHAIVTMPAYFADYDTVVRFITAEELARDHAGMPHGGFVITSGNTGWERENNHVIEYSLKLGSNPEFTSSVLTAYARAAYKMHRRGITGCKTVFDVAPADLSALTPEEMRARLL